jgi:uncharacterized protein
MEFTNEFRVPSDIETTFATLTDLEQVAPCLPGATLEEVDGDTYSGKVKVKVGPMQVVYKGTARLAEVDDDAKRGRIEAKGKETRGTGTAAADVTATLVEDGAGTRVTVVTDLKITGKPAQFGRGVLQDVGTKIIDTFAQRLREMLEAGEAAEAPAEGAPAEAAEAPAEGAPAGDRPAQAAPGPEAVVTGAAAAAPSGPRRIEPTPGREDDVLDLMEVAGAATAKRVLPLVAALLAIIGLVWWWRRR